jgi:hypothetical protein
MPDTLEESRPATAPRTEDRASFRLAVFGAVLIVTLFAGYGLGRLNSGDSRDSGDGGDSRGSRGSASRVNNGTTPNGTGTAAAAPGMPGMTGNESQPHAHNADGTVTEGGTTSALNPGAAPGGLSLSAGGLTLVPATTRFQPGRKQKLTFTITGAGGAPVTTYAIVHDKPLHLIVIRRDLTGYQHLHPTMAPDGAWSVDLTLAAPGSYRAIADFTAIVGGQQVATTLGTDLTVAGSYLPLALPAPVRQVTTQDFTVSYEGTPSTASTQPILMTVTAPDGRPAGLQPYLGAFGHLVMMRDGDLGYVHVHPEAQLADGKVKFWLAAPGPGTYRMFFDFQVGGRVHTAAWTTAVS